MGRGISISCAECDYKKDIMLGIGMMYSPSRLEDIDSEDSLFPSLIKSKKTLDMVKELLKERCGHLADDYGHALYRCSKCEGFYERFYFHIDYIGGSYEPAFKCPKCKNVLIKIASDEEDDIRIDLTSYSCPKCGKKSLKEDTTIHWD